MSGDEREDIRDLLAELRFHRAKLIPVIGAGLSIEAGGISSSELVTHLMREAEIDLGTSSLYEVADALEILRGPEWVQDKVAEAVTARQLTPTAPLMALSHTPIRILATTNYDRSAQTSIEAVGFTPITFTLARANEALQDPDLGNVHVIHIHGFAEESRSIVLTASSYQEAKEDPGMQHVLWTLAAQHQVIFLGQALGERETHIRRDLTWSAEAFERTGPHFLILPVGDLDIERIEFFKKTTVSPRTFANKGGTYDAVRWVAQTLGGSSAIIGSEMLPRLSAHVDPHYLQPPLALSKEVATRNDRQVWEYTSRLSGGTELSLSDLDGKMRVVLRGEGGYGKTQMLYHLAQRYGDQWPVYFPMGSAVAAQTGEDDVDVFVFWMRLAQAGNVNVPKVTRTSLEEGSYTFLLDGLDQMSVADREAVITTVSRVSERFPQHRLILTTRRVSQATMLERVGFVFLEIVPRDDWLLKYAKGRGLSGQEIAALTDSVPAIADLLKIPLFGAAATDLVTEGGKLPDNALELVGLLANKGLRFEEQNLRAPREAVSKWLDRIALTMELAGISEIDRPALLEAGLQHGLELGSTEELLEQLISRALLAEAEGRVRFAANVVQEARAARAVLEMDEGVEFVKEHVLVEVNGRTAIRSSWTHTMDLLLSQAPAEWREEIGKYDELAVIRSVDPQAPLEERTRAIRDLWAWYSEVAIWLPRDRKGELHDDLTVLTRLSANGVKPGPVQQISEAARDPDFVQRGNAILALQALDAQEEIRSVLPTLIGDVHSVVRRHAAIVAGELGLDDSIDQLMIQLDGESDELAEETISWAIIKLLPNDALGSFVLARSKTRSAWRLWSALDERWTRLEQLQFLKQPNKFSSEWFHHLIRDEAEWTEDELRLVSAIHFSQDLRSRVRSNVDLRGILQVHPLAAFQEGLKRAATARDVRELWFLTSYLSPAELLEQQDLSQNEATTQALNEMIEVRKSHVPSEPALEVPPSQTLAGIITDDATDVLLARNMAQEVDGLGHEMKTRLRRLVEAAWVDWEEVHGDVLDAVEQNEGRISVPRRVLNLLEYASAIQLNLKYATWAKLLSLQIHVGNESAWLRAAFVEDWFRDLASSIGGMDVRTLEELVQVVPLPWPHEFAEPVAHRIFLANTSDHSRASVVEMLLESGHLELLRQLAKTYEDDSLTFSLVKIGDCEVEADLLSLALKKVDVMPRLLVGREDHWLSFVRCESSVPLIKDLVKDLFSREERSSDIELLYQALNRAGGDSALDVYEELMQSDEIEGSGFFWYPRDSLLRELSEKRAQETLPDSFHGIGELVRSVV